jgi:hypothetical protein
VPKKKTPDEKSEKQFERFVEAARQHNVDPNDAEKVFKSLANPKAPRPKRTSD